MDENPAYVFRINIEKVIVEVEFAKGTNLKVYQLIKKSILRWADEDASIYGSSISYYTIFSAGPLVTIMIWVMGILYKRDSVNNKIVELFRDALNNNVAALVQGLIINAAERSTQGLWATIIGIAITIFSAMRIVIIMKEALDKMWHNPHEKSQVKLWKKYMIGFVGILGIGIVMLISGIMNTAVWIMSHTVLNLLPFQGFVIRVANNIVVFLSVTMFIALMFKYLPNLKIKWKGVIPGALFTSALFFIGKILFSTYLSTQVFDSTYGAASTLVVFILWVYFSTQVVFLGAVFTHTYALDGDLILHSKKHTRSSS